MKIRTFASVLALVLAGLAYGDDWSDASAAFERGDYAAALAGFEALHAAGLDTPAVHYNIGVSQYRLGRDADAALTFRIIGRRFPQLRGLAEYNLGLIARRRGDSGTAVRHFLAAYRAANDDRTLRVLASRRLRELEPEFRSASQWSGAFGLRLGFDDNVVLRDDTSLPVGTTTESPVAEIFASIRGPYRPAGGFMVEGSIYAIHNVDADDFDQSQLDVAAMYDWRPGAWRLRARLHAGAGSIGGDAFDRKLGAELQATRYLNARADVEFRAGFDDVDDADEQFAGVAGHRRYVEGNYRWYSGSGHRVGVRVRREENDRLDPAVSPDRSVLGIGYRYQPERGWGFESRLRYRRSEYDDIAVARTEELLGAAVGLSRTLGTDWLLLLEYRYDDNDSTDPLFTYERSIATLGFIRSF